MQPIDNDKIREIAERSLDGLPAQFRNQLGGVAVRVQEFAEQHVLDELGIEHPMHLSGLYTGIPIGEKSVWAPSAPPDQIFLYSRPIIAEAEERGISLDEMVHHVLIHEIGHHFGFSDADMHQLEDGGG